MSDEPLVLDPSAVRRPEEEVFLQSVPGPVRVDILGELAWAVADPDLLARLLADPRVSKDPRQHWPRFIDGEIEGKWPLYLQVSVDNMFTAYGSAHRRLRRLVAPAFAASRLDALIPSVERNTSDLIVELAGYTARIGGAVDLRSAFAAQLPVRVIGDVLGVPEALRRPFKDAIDRIWDTTSSAEQAMAATVDVYAAIDELIRVKRAAPADDMTSVLIAARDDEEGDGTALTERELADTLLLVIAAGYETTVNLIDSAITGLLTDPVQLEHVRQGRAGWGDVVEEALRHSAPVSHMPMRYAVEDIALPTGVTIRAGETILPSYGAASNHPKRHGDSARSFEVTRADKSHIAFGHGAHFCLGAPLARAEGVTALRELFGRFPTMRLAVPAADLVPIPSILGNGHTTLPVHLV